MDDPVAAHQQVLGLLGDLRTASQADAAADLGERVERVAAGYAVVRAQHFGVHALSEPVALLGHLGDPAVVLGALPGDVGADARQFSVGLVGGLLGLLLLGGQAVHLGQGLQRLVLPLLDVGLTAGDGDEEGVVLVLLLWLYVLPP